MFQEPAINAAASAITFFMMSDSSFPSSSSTHPSRFFHFCFASFMCFWWTALSLSMCLAELAPDRSARGYGSENSSSRHTGLSSIETWNSSAIPSSKGMYGTPCLLASFSATSTPGVPCRAHRCSKEMLSRVPSRWDSVLPCTEAMGPTGRVVPPLSLATPLSSLTAGKKPGGGSTQNSPDMCNVHMSSIRQLTDALRQGKTRLSLSAHWRPILFQAR
mmetsp:Transcript_61421/g.174444  ORF Transcript_61421/g.174444 Transcript_61421/m.174444 type:complete len:218 (+) Transcript_61421:241-894(+)